NGLVRNRLWLRIDEEIALGDILGGGPPWLSGLHRLGVNLRLPAVARLTLDKHLVARNNEQRMLGGHLERVGRRHRRELEQFAIEVADLNRIDAVSFSV